jgi:hypothetical protein
VSESSEFILGSAPSVVRLDTIEIAHPNFTQTYRLVATVPPGASSIEAMNETWDYCPMQVLPIAASDDMVQALNVTLGDVGDIIAREIEAVWDANGLNTRPTLTYRAFRSDALDAPIAGSERVLEIASVTTTREGASFEARAPELNQSRTGILYDLDVMPMLRGFL